MIISCLLELQVWLKCLWWRRRIWNLYVRLSIVQEENNHVRVTNASGSYLSGGKIIVNMYLNIIVLCSRNFWVCGWNPVVWPFKWKLLSSTFLWYCLFCCTRWFWLLSLWMISYSLTIKMKATEQYFPVVQCNILFKLVLTIEF